MRRRARRSGGAARALAFEILHRVEAEGAYASVLLDHYQGTLDDARDASLAREIVLGVLRRRAAIDHVLAALSNRPLERIDPPVWMALRVGAYEILFLDKVPDFAAVDTSVELVKRGPSRGAAGFVNAVLRRVAREGRDRLPPAPARDDVAGLARHHSHPEWWTARVVERLGWDDAARLLAANNVAAATVLCANPRRIDRDALAARLRERGIETEPCRFAPRGLRVRFGVPQRTTAFDEGLFWIQDEGSQLVPLLFGPLAAPPAVARAEQPGVTGGAPATDSLTTLLSAERGAPRILDACAAPGTKTLTLALETPGAWVVACDLSAGRLRRMRNSLERVGAANVALLAADLGVAPPPLRGAFDAVLVDAPCSGTGTLRRHPEIRWRLRPDDPARLADLQRRILENASTLVAPGGRLVYAVCSLEPEEGERVVEGFVRDRPEFALGDPRPGLPEAARARIDRRGFLRTSPAEGGLDGFFGALLLRR